MHACINEVTEHNASCLLIQCLRSRVKEKSGVWCCPYIQNLKTALLYETLSQKYSNNNDDDDDSNVSRRYHLLGENVWINMLLKLELVFWNKVFLCSLGWSWTPLFLRQTCDPPDLVPQVLEVQAWATPSSVRGALGPCLLIGKKTV